MNITSTPYRITPNMEASAYVTYRVVAPLQTHWITATCADVQCSTMQSGFKLVLDESTDLGAKQSYYIRHDKSRSPVESRTGTGLTQFTYAAGNNCFIEHKRQIAPDKFLVQGGDYRGNPLGIQRVHTKPEFWVEDFQGNQDRLKTLIERG